MIHVCGLELNFIYSLWEYNRLLGVKNMYAIFANFADTRKQSPKKTVVPAAKHAHAYDFISKFAK